MKKLISLLMCGILVLGMVACSSDKDSNSGNDAQTDGMNIMFVVTGSLGGGNNVDDVKEALDEYVAANGGKVDTIECKMDTSIYQSMIEQAAESEEYDLIVTGFSTMIEPLCNVADQFPEQKFLLFDAAIDFDAKAHPNCISIQALQNEGAFLVGALSALMTTSEDAERANAEDVVGFVGAIDSIAVRDFLFGFVDGVRYVSDSTEILYSIVGDHYDATKTMEVALSQYQSGADIIFAVSNSDVTVADVANENDFYAICCDADEATRMARSNINVANHITTSVIKDYKGMIAPVLVDIGNGKAEWGTHKYISYADGGVIVVENEFFDAQVPASVKEKFDAIKADLVDGKITVSTAYNATADEIDAKIAQCSAK